MKNTIRKTLAIITLVLLIATVIITFYYWITHSELSQMQIFLKFWWLYAINLVLITLLNETT